MPHPRQLQLPVTYPNPRYAPSERSPPEYLFPLLAHSQIKFFFQRINPRFDKTYQRFNFGEITMPKQIEWQFINYRLDKDEVRAFEEWQTTHTDNLYEVMNDLMSAGYKLSLSWDDKHTCFIATVTGGEASKNAGKSVSSRADEWSVALLMNIYKIRVVFKNGTWNSRLDESYG